MSPRAPSLTIEDAGRVVLRADHREIAFHDEQAEMILKRWNYIVERHGASSSMAHGFIVNRIEQELREAARA